MEIGGRVPDKSPTSKASPAHSLHGNSKRPVLNFSWQNPPHGISLRRPQMKQAAVVIAGNRILGLRQIECNRAIFQHDQFRRIRPNNPGPNVEEPEW
jgi:hypothetical protein